MSALGWVARSSGCRWLALIAGAAPFAPAPASGQTPPPEGSVHWLTTVSLDRLRESWGVGLRLGLWADSEPWRLALWPGVSGIAEAGREGFEERTIEARGQSCVDTSNGRVVGLESCDQVRAIFGFEAAVLRLFGGPDGERLGAGLGWRVGEGSGPFATLEVILARTGASRYMARVALGHGGGSVGVGLRF